MCEKGAEPSQRPGTKRIVGAISDEISVNGQLSSCTYVGDDVLC